MLLPIPTGVATQNREGAHQTSLLPEEQGVGAHIRHPGPWDLH